MEQINRRDSGAADAPGDRFDLDALLHPAKAFAHPMNVVRDPDLSIAEKRAILASWASDACALAATPELRVTSSGNLVRWDDIMEALRALDDIAGDKRDPLPRYKRILARKRGSLARHPVWRRGGAGQQGSIGAG